MIKEERFEKAMKSLDEAYAIRDEFINACENLNCLNCSQHQNCSCKLQFKYKPVEYEKICDLKGLLDFLKDKELPCNKEVLERTKRNTEKLTYFKKLSTQGGNST